MKPEEENKKAEEERDEAEDRPKKPYAPPELTRHGPVAEMTGPDVSES